ncbi:spore coat protein [Clostridium aestuarii]|uniref:Spore coat protein n=1 Tax=Clostridium aestuarii TaxID=338193 RepID=A0ABT4D2W6_9CLOT|nr:spore coat protein [Clostridium aestuarii]MCY6485583.1 spore coat protein [Clostridium aestuarii]
MNSLSGNCFFEYVKEKKIRKIEPYKAHTVKNEITDEQALNQLYIISQFHKRVNGYDNYIGHRLEDKRGRTIEQYKIYIKRIKYEYETVKRKTEINSFEKLFLKYGEKYLNKAEECIEEVYNNRYLEIIRRSMDRIEICLGDTYFTNLRKNNCIEVVNFEDCCYDLVEIDGIYFLNKLKSKGKNLSFDMLINKFCEYENLDKESEIFMKALFEYPYEFMKCCMKYKKNKNNKNNYDKYINKLNKVIRSEELL